MRVLVVGSGGREHALAWKLSQASSVSDLHAAPGNPGMASCADLHAIAADDIGRLTELAVALEPDLVVVGPEAPLVAGLADVLRDRGVRVFGPSAAAAQIEGSKAFAKEVMIAAGVPTARSLAEPKAPCVLKADGLAAGKGVFVCETDADVERALPAVHDFGSEVIIEELLVGREISVFALCDGSTARALPVAQDYKRIGENDEGPNTGGMGSYSPAELPGGVTPDEIVEQVHEPVLRELARRGSPFTGLLYAGLMLDETGSVVLEFNCRFGDPETQSILPRLDNDLGELLLAASSGDLSNVAVSENEKVAVTVVMASAGYPEAPRTGALIRGSESVTPESALVFHAGTALVDGEITASGGRVLNVTGLGPSIDTARERAYQAISGIDFPGGQFRRDIARIGVANTV
ncbi:MAG: phosphoribosylamine--glycine ligase [Gaiellaceae bacterium]